MFAIFCEGDAGIFFTSEVISGSIISSGLCELGA